jgi:hypothetical protein
MLPLCSAIAACDGGDGAGTGGGGGAAGSGGTGGAPTTGAGSLDEPNRFFLRIEDAPLPPIVLELDKQKGLEVFGADAARQIKLLDVDSTALLTNALTSIQNACGTAWQSNDPNPMHDCSATPLGQSFGSNWQTTPEFAMVRLLSMTPANANAIGTSLEEFQQLIQQNYPGMFSKSFGEILAESVGIDTDPMPGTMPVPVPPVIPMSMLVQAVQRQLLGSHPAINDPSGTMSITMYDALLDMAPLATRLGPVGAPPWDGPGEHPGVLVPDDGSFTTKSDALLPNFKMRVVAESNLRWVSGVDLSDGAGDMFLQEGAAALSFDFNDPQKLQIEGLADSPTMDMRFSLRELPGVVPSCTDVPSCKANHPDTPVGAGTVWTLPPWLLEPIVGRAGLLTYGNRTFSQCYLIFNGCQVGVDIGQNGDPAGWAVFTANLAIGDPPTQIDAPDPQFLWELLTEFAQVAVHDPTGDGIPDIPEGQAVPVFALHGVPIGLTGPELIAQMRPTLQSQSQLMSDVILGRYWKNNDALDFYYRRAAPGGPAYLYFAADSDLRPDPSNSNAIKPYTYETPGFYTSPDLAPSSKVSEKVIPGVDDATHEKYQLPAGETVLYMRDDEGAVYEVRFYVPEDNAAEIAADVKRL